VVEGLFSDTLFFNDDVLWQHSLEWEGLWNLDEDVAEDVQVSYETRYFRRQTDNRSFFASLEAVYSKNLNGHRQVVLGGLTGARAFDNRFQVGDRSLLLTLEERLYTDIHLWNLIRVGGALFVDMGRAWEPGFDNGVEDELLANIGVGLRLASSKAASGRIAHIDFAFPLTNRNDRDARNLQISVNIKGRF
jgi:hemolysin activation/secretion protein|tara:strand:- start:1237 stop:1809 length:573 start_codon:yes stop_codon:yes gene_type:complete